jgi:hypothetical protein
MLKQASIALFAMLSALSCASPSSIARMDARAAQLTAPSPAPATATERRDTPADAPLSFAHVVHDGGLRILLEHSPDEAWAQGAPKLLSKGSPVVVRRDVDATKLPQALTAAIGRKVDLMRAGEKVCEARVTGLSMIGRVEPHFGQRNDWDGIDEPHRAPLSADEIAAEAWEMSDAGGHAIAAELSSVTGEGCASATWARDHEASTPRVAKATPARPELHDRALAALRKLQSYAEIQGAYEASEPGRKGEAWEVGEGTDLSVYEMRFGGGAGAWVWVSARTRESCGTFYGEIAALWELREGPDGAELALRYEEPAAPESEPEAAMAREGGGSIDVLFTGARLRQVASRYQLDAAIVPYLDCPC